MVVSVLDKSINYPEIRSINEDDKSTDVSLFFIELLDVQIVASVGSEQYTFIDKGIAYIPLYLIHDDKGEAQIGVYEFMAADVTNLLDSDGNIDVELLNEPLLYSFVTKEYLEKYADEVQKHITDSDDDTSTEESTTDEDEGHIDMEDEEDEDEEDEDEEDEEDEDEEDEDDEASLSLTGLQTKLKGESVLPHEDTIIKELFEEDEDDEEKDETKEKQKGETKEDDNKYRSTFKSGSNWIQKYMKNNNYQIVDNEGGGDCFFAVIRDAFKSIGKNVSVGELRSILAREATEEVFQGNKMMYDMFNNEIITTKEQMTKLQKEFNYNKKLLQRTVKVPTPSVPEDKNGISLPTEKKALEASLTDKVKSAPAILSRQEKKQLIALSKELKRKWKILKQEHEYALENINEYKHMKGVNTLEDFRKLIKTSKFWAETWTISTIERVLNVKVIILSEEAYTRGAYGSVLQCGQLNDTILQDKGVFKPKYYIVTEYLGNHYKSVSYKGRKILRYENIPYHLKEIVVDKCMEKNAGVYSIIPKFKKFKEHLQHKEIDEVGEVEVGEVEVGEVEEDGSELETDKTPIGTPVEPKLYDEDIVFQFYKRSADKSPGKGSGEKIPGSKRMQFAELDAIKDWRRILSNFAHTPFELDGHKWLSVEHYFQASKFKEENPGFYDQFAMDSNTELGKVLSQNPEMAKGAGSETGKYKGKQIRPKEIKVESKFFTEKASGVMDKALHAKFTQNEEAKKVLKATKDAKLVVYAKGSPAETFTILMKVRNSL